MKPVNRSAISSKTASKRWLFIVPVLILLGYVGKSGFSMMMADLYHHHVNTYLEHWAEGFNGQGGDYRISANELKVALKNANRAINKAPEDPEQLLLLAKVQQWHPFFEPLSHDQLLLRQPKELDLIRKAVALRPAWPYGWIELAEAKARHSEIDREFNQALVQAGVLGPWEKYVMITLERLEAHYQKWLNPEAKVIAELNRQRLGR